MSFSGDKLNISWNIENYSYYIYRNNKNLLLSPTFSFTNEKWCRIIFNADKVKKENYLLLYLNDLSKDPIFMEKQVDINIKLCNADGEEFETFKEKDELPQSEFTRYFQFCKILKHDELEEKLKKSPNDCLIVRCEISTGKSQTDRKRRNYIAKSTILLAKYSFNVNVDFGKPMNEYVLLTDLKGRCIKIWFKAPEDDVLIIIGRTKKKDKDCKLKCEIFLLDDHNNEILSSSEMFYFDHESPEDTVWNFPSFFKKSHLLNREMHNQCHLRFNIFISDGKLFHEGVEEVDNCDWNSHNKAPDNLAVESLQNDFSAMMLKSNYTDVKLLIGKETIRAHKFILASRSPVFSAMFDQDMVESRTGMIQVVDTNPDTMKLFLKFLYTGMLDKLDCETMLELLLAAEKYQVPSLKKKCSDILISLLDADNVCDVVSVADMVGHTVLKTAAINYIKDHVEILGSSKWPDWVEKNVKLGSEIVCKISYVITKSS